MDFSQCFTLLQSRGQATTTEDEVCACINLPKKVSSSSSSEVGILCGTCEGSNAVVDNTATELLLLPILDNFIRLQEERVQVYKEFDATLKSLIEQKLINQYSESCAGITAKFSKISNVIINLQKQLLTMGDGKVAAGLISRIQKVEKEKLLLVAAKHLDLLQDEVPALHTLTGGKSAAQQVYLQRQIAEAEYSISESLEEIHSLRCDFILNAHDN